LPYVLWIVGRPVLAEKIERALFDKGWQAQLVSNTEFSAAQLRAVIRVLQRIGTIAVCSISADDADLRKEVAAICGDASFFPADLLTGGDEEACGVLLHALDQQQGLAGPVRPQ